MLVTYTITTTTTFTTNNYNNDLQTHNGEDVEVADTRASHGVAEAETDGFLQHQQRGLQVGQVLGVAVIGLQIQVVGVVHACHHT